KVVEPRQAEAQAAITAAKLEPKISEAPNAKPAGTVVAQDPAANEEVDEGSEVTLTVSTGPATVNVPDIQGKTQDEATKLLSDAGFVPSAKQVENADVEEGMVIGDS